MRATVYLHSSKEQMAEIGRKLGLTGKAFDFFLFACNEVELILEVDNSGEARIISVNNQEVNASA